MNKPKYDVFISHASEDKEAFVRPLALSLLKFGLEVWYDEYTLNVGDSLSKSLDTGLANSKFGIVVLSDQFLNKNWTDYELRSLLALQQSDGKRRILPV